MDTSKNSSGASKALPSERMRVYTKSSGWNCGENDSMKSTRFGVAAPARGATASTAAASANTM